MVIIHNAISTRPLWVAPRDNDRNEFSPRKPKIALFDQPSHCSHFNEWNGNGFTHLTDHVLSKKLIFLQPHLAQAQIFSSSVGLLVVGVLIRCSCWERLFGLRFCVDLALMCAQDRLSHVVATSMLTRGTRLAPEVHCLLYYLTLQTRP